MNVMTYRYFSLLDYNCSCADLEGVGEGAYSKHDMSQLHDKCPKTFEESHLTTLGVPFSRFFLKPRPEVRVKMNQKQYVTLCDPKMYLHIKFRIPT